MTKRLIEYNLPLADIFETPVESAFIALSRMQRTLKGLFQRPSALVPRDGLKPSIREAVLSNAEVIYAA